jgi:hypothetical protein
MTYWHGVPCKRVNNIFYENCYNFTLVCRKSLVLYHINIYNIKYQEDDDSWWIQLVAIHVFMFLTIIAISVCSPTILADYGLCTNNIKTTITIITWVLHLIMASHEMNLPYPRLSVSGAISIPWSVYLVYFQWRNQCDFGFALKLNCINLALSIAFGYYSHLPSR